jgi:hypothetical protein
MKVMVLSAQRARGVSAKTQNDYDICTIVYGTPVQSVQRPTRQVTGYGYDTQEMQLDPASLAQFSKAVYPCVLDLVIEPDPRNMQRNICKGIAA